MRTVRHRRYRPKIADLCCGAGGAGKGYHDAGFDVVGFDISPQRHYPYEFRQANILDLDPDALAAEFDAVHASPPCQHYSQAVPHANKAGYPDLVPPARELLRKTGLPYVIENVPGAPLESPVELCGCMFGMDIVLRRTPLALYRPRLFELGGWSAANVPQHRPHRRPALPVMGRGVPGWFYRKHGFRPPAAHQKILMGCPWMSRDAMAESIPPAFTRFLGEQLIRHLAGELDQAA